MTAAACVLVLAVGVYVWREATALPEWYAELDSESSTVDETDDVPPPQWVTVPDAPPAEARPPQQAALIPGTSKQKRRTATRHELRGFHRRGSKTTAGSPVKASRATYEDGRLEAGVVLDLSRIPKDQLVERDRELLDRAVQQFPGLTKRDVYVGIEDHPVSAAGVLQLGPAAELRVGNLRYPLDTAAKKIGMSPAELRRELDRELHRLGFVDPTSED